MAADILTALYAFLVDEPTLAAIRGDRLYPSIAPQKAAMPYQTFQLIDSPRVRYMGGTSGLVNPRVQINSFAETFDAMRQLNEATRLVVTPLHGEVGSSNNWVNIRDIDWEQGTLGMERQFEGQEVGAFVARSDMVVWHFETAIARS